LTKDDMEIVPALRDALAGRVGKERFELWFGAGTRLYWDGCALTVGAPSRFFVDWLRSNFRRHIEAASVETLGKCPAIKFRVEGQAAEDEEAAENGAEAAETGAENSAQPAAAVASGSSSTASRAPGGTGRGANGGSSPTAEASLPAAASTAKPAETPFARRRFASLSTFVSGPGNHLALVSAEMVARSPGRITPLLIHGPTSVGKTHLLEGIWTAARKSCGGMSAVYLSAEQFTSQFLEALRGSGLPSFRRKCRGGGLLILDDLQFLAGKRATQVELLHTVDTLLREGRQLVVAADRAPAELTEFTQELSTRLTSGMVCRIDPPDFPTRLGIVGQLAKRRGLELTADVQRFVASRLTTHARELSGAICRLQATSEALKQKITLALAEEALREMIQRNSRVVRLGDIQKAVCTVFGLDPASLQSHGKCKRVSHPRMLAMWLARKHTRAALSEIGQFFGQRSHSTVISAQKRVDQWMADGQPLNLAEQTWQIDEAVRQVEQQLLAG
jgi:chromosomal replication initiator protein